MGTTRPEAKTKRRGRGRPPLPKSLRRGDEERVTLRLTLAERTQLKKLAARWGVTLGEALRRCFAKVAAEEKE